MVQLAGPVGLDRRGISGCFLGSNLLPLFTSLADANFALALEKHHLHFYADNWRESHFSKKEKRKERSLSWFTFSKAASWGLCGYLFFHSAVWLECRVHDVEWLWPFWQKTNTLRQYICAFWPWDSRPANSLLLSSEERNIIAVLLSVVLQTVSLFSSPEHLRLIFNYFFGALTCLFTSESFFFIACFWFALTLALTINAPLRKHTLPLIHPLANYGRAAFCGCFHFQLDNNSFKNN